MPTPRVYVLYKALGMSDIYMFGCSQILRVIRSYLPCSRPGPWPGCQLCIPGLRIPMSQSYLIILFRPCHLHLPCPHLTSLTIWALIAACGALFLVQHSSRTAKAASLPIWPPFHIIQAREGYPLPMQPLQHGGITEAAEAAVTVYEESWEEEPRCR